MCSWSAKVWRPVAWDSSPCTKSRSSSSVSGAEKPWHTQLILRKWKWFYAERAVKLGIAFSEMKTALQKKMMQSNDENMQRSDHFHQDFFPCAVFLLCLPKIIKNLFPWMCLFTKCSLLLPLDVLFHMRWLLIPSRGLKKTCWPGTLPFLASITLRSESSPKQRGRSAGVFGHP